MALLQIAEPGMSTAPHQHRLAVGIDLGTTNSLVATVRSSAAECLPDVQGRVLLPSIVRYGPDGSVEVGYDALAIYVHPANPLDAITFDQLAGIYGEDGALVRWSHLGAAGGA